MKKLLIILTLLLTGCQSSSKDNPIIIYLPSPTPALEEVESNTIRSIIGEKVEQNIETIEKDFSAFDNIVVDNDLTKLSGTMAQGVFGDFMYDSNKYLDQTIKVQGIYYEASNPDNDEIFKGILIVDKTQCCSGYLDIKLENNIIMPQANEEIMLIGTIKQDQEGLPYILLSDILF